MASNTTDDQARMGCPDCHGTGCATCGRDGQVPTWLADPKVNGEAAARSWGWRGPKN